ncbi:MAG: TatD family hydrolase [Clostridia bacterium]|nr:TatD family hydrolase [Clostridia bacterium]
MNIFDTHAHYYDDRFAEEYPGGVKGAIEAALSGGVSHIVNIGTNLESSKTCLALSEQYPTLYVAVGIYPHEATYEDMEATVDALRQMLTHPKAVAIGEIGLDYHWDDVDRETQKIWFERQLCLAEETGYPVVIHDREAHGDCLDAIRRHPKVTGIFHSYSGSGEMVKELIKLGWYVSFSGVVTYKNAAKTKEAAAATPLDRLLIETDCPYLTPVPHRGKINHSTYLVHTAAELAAIKGISTEELIQAAAENAKLIFDLL